MKHINLMYHDVFKENTSESGFLRERDLPYKIKADVFEEHVKEIVSLCRERHIPKDSVVFTFDDGGKSFYRVIAPILEKYGYRGIFFISTKFIGSKTFLNEEEIKSLFNAGHVIGSHAHSHEHFHKLSDNEIEREWRISVEILSKIIGQPITYGSIPNGDISEIVLNSAQLNGIKYLYTSEPTTSIGTYDGMEILGRYVVLANSTLNNILSIVFSSRMRTFLFFKRKCLGVVKSILGDKYIKVKNFIFK